MNEHQNNGDGYSYIKKVWITTGIVAFTAILLLLLEATFNVFLLIFAGILIAVFFRGFSGLIQRKTRWNEKVCVGISIIGSLTIVVGFFWLIGAQVQTQIAELAETLPKTVETVKNRLEGTPLGNEIIDRATSEESIKNVQAFAGGFFRSTFGVFGDLYVLLFIGIFLTVAPQMYINGMVDLIPIKGQGKAIRIFQELG